MFDADKWQEILATLRKNKLRTFLTACGVFWGIFMLLVMLAFGNGLERGVAGNMRGFATNSVYVWGQRTTMPYDGMQPGRWISYDNSDMEALRLELPGIEHLAPRNQLGGHRGSASVTRGKETAAFSVMGDYPQFRLIQPMKFTSGRFINAIDIERNRKVCVIGNTVREQLFGEDEEPLGEYIRINGVYFQVVGVFESFQAGDGGDRQASTVFIPFTTFQQAFNIGDRVAWFAVTGKPHVSAKQIEERVRAFLKARHDVHPEDDPAIGSWNAGENFGKMMSLFSGIEMLIWFVGVFTLLAGVIGVSNIMLIAVKERTKEIGIRKALGATPGSVIALILQESVVLTAVAGYAGVVASVGVLQVVGSVIGGEGMLAKPQVNFDVAVIATLILIVSGMVAGWIPARQAARVNPVDALRAE